MQIAVNARFLLKGRLEGFGHYTQEIIRRIAAGHPEDGLHLFFDRTFSRDFIYTHHVRGKALWPPARHPILFYLWNQWALRSALHKISPDVFFSPDGFMPLRLRLPSVITVHDVAHQKYPDAISTAQRKYYAHFIPRFLQEAYRVITVSEFSKNEILKYYPIDAKKIVVIYNGVGSSYRPHTSAEQDAIRREYTQGYPYFLFVGAIHPRKNVARLIEAYTVFRNTTKERIKLLIAGRKSWDYAAVNHALAQSPFRDDIIFTGYVATDKLVGITASALALCYVSLYEGFGLPVAEAMACGVPVIVSKNSAQAEVAGTAGLNVDPTHIDEISGAMQQIVRGEEFRKSMIQQGIERSRIFSWDTAAADTYAVLAEAAHLRAR